MVAAFIKARRESNDMPFEKFNIERARKEALEITNKMSMDAYVDACAVGPVGIGPVTLDNKDERQS